MEFNAELYEFLKENETHIWKEKSRLNFGVHVYFSNIKDFISIVGTGVLDDGGIETTLNSDTTLFIPLEDIFESYGFELKHYKYCFDDDDVERYKEEIENY